MEQETKEQVTAPADNGLKEVAEKMDKFFADYETAKAETAEAKKAAEEAKQTAQKAIDEAVAAKNAHSVNFAPIAPKADKKEVNVKMRKFLADVKAARFNESVKAALSTDA